MFSKHDLLFVAGLKICYQFDPIACPKISLGAGDVHLCIENIEKCGTCKGKLAGTYLNHSTTIYCSII